MKRAIIIYRGVDNKVCHCNLSADKLEMDGNFLRVIKGDNELVGVFSTLSIEGAYLSEKRGEHDE